MEEAVLEPSLGRTHAVERPHSPPRFDFEHWPLLLVNLPAGVDLADLVPFYEKWEWVCRNRGVHALLVDVVGFDRSFASLSARRAASEELQKRRDLLEANVIAQARILPHPVMRAVASAYDWMISVSYPIRNTPSETMAMSWLLEQAESHGLTIPSSEEAVLATLARLREGSAPS